MSDEVDLPTIRRCLESMLPSTIATCGADGNVNATYLSKVYYVDEEHVALSYQFFSKTHRNLRDNTRAQVLMVDFDTGAQYRLDLEFLRTETEGPVFESMRAQIETIASLTGMSDVFVLRGADVFRVHRCRRLAMRTP